MSAIFHESPLGQFTAQAEVGVVSLPGSCEYDPARQAYTISGAGSDIWGEQDAFHFVWKRLRGDFILTARSTWIGAGIHPQRKIGWMARRSLEANSPHVSAALHGNGLLSLQFRRKSGGQTEEVCAFPSAPDVLQLERKGGTFSMSAASYGEPFSLIQVAGIDLGEDVLVGLFVCAHEEACLEQAVFQDVRIIQPVQVDFERGRDPFGSLLEILDVESGHRQVIYSSDDVFEAPNWRRDGQALIFNRGGRLVQFDLASGAQALLDTGDVLGNNNDHVLSFDGSRLAISSHNEIDRLARIYTVPVQGGQPRLVTPKGPSYLHGWSPDGRFLVYCAERNGQYDVYRIPVEGGEEIQLTDTPGLDDGPEYTPDGKFIYFNSVRSGRMQIWRMKPDGSHPQQMTDDKCNNWFPHISPDGKWVAFISYLPGEVQPGDHPPARRVYLRLVPLEGGIPKVLAYLYGGQGTMNVPSWSPDGKRLAFVSNTVPE
jgi:TolB protein